MIDTTVFADSPATRDAPAPQVSLRLVYLARLREVLGSAGETVHLPAGRPVALSGLVAHLRARGGAFEREFAPGRSYRAAVNHSMATHDTPVCDGDEVAFFPPVTGG
jgi:molybdopterin synthase sulfur carrier subunit